MPNRASQVYEDFGHGIRSTAIMIHKVIAAKPTLANTMVSGGSAETTSPTKKNELPQSTDNVNSITQTLGLIVVSIVGGIVTVSD